MFQVILYNCANGNKIQKSVTQYDRPTDVFVEKSREFYGADRAEVIELPFKKAGMFWKQADIETNEVDPHILYIHNRGGKGRIMMSEVFSGMDGQAVHSALSGWMDYRKAHLTVNAYIESFYQAHHVPVSEI